MKKYGLFSSQDGYMLLVAMLLVVVIVAMLCQALWKSYFKKPLFSQEGENSLFEQSGLTTMNTPAVAGPSYHSVLKDTRQTIQGFNEKILQREKQIEELKK